MRFRIVTAAFLLVAGTSLASAQSPSQASPAAQPPSEHDVTALAKKTQNPVGNLISVPLQFNFNGGGDLGDETAFNLNVQPVIPFRLTDSTMVIARTIIPLDSFPGPDTTRYGGVGDIQMQLFATPTTPRKITLGIGPVFSLPTATAVPAQTGTWAAGVGGVIVADVGKFVIGGLISQYWPLQDSGGEPETDLFVSQPFVNYNFAKGWALAFAPLITANWNAADGEQWTVPLGLGISKTTVFNSRPMQLAAQYYRNVERPTGSAGNQLRLVMSLLFPPRPGP